MGRVHSMKLALILGLAGLPLLGFQNCSVVRATGNGGGYEGESTSPDGIAPKTHTYVSGSMNCADGDYENKLILTEGQYSEADLVRSACANLNTPQKVPVTASGERPAPTVLIYSGVLYSHSDPAQASGTTPTPSPAGGAVANVAPIFTPPEFVPGLYCYGSNSAGVNVNLYLSWRSVDDMYDTWVTIQNHTSAIAVTTSGLFPSLITDAFNASGDSYTIAVGPTYGTATIAYTTKFFNGTPDLPFGTYSPADGRFQDGLSVVCTSGR